ncbi:hypothetical protein CEXT_553701 [Caerostris extrusa]|uniref:Uncharacterized protein n=1 Tax=Caerostris extrusa TaxID=172846 RepID=A0AAV4Q0Q1_CAEEX|nr:hypothetical protein CEXT_553701 [Caerostris extrusa]
MFSCYLHSMVPNVSAFNAHKTNAIKRHSLTGCLNAAGYGKHPPKIDPYREFAGAGRAFAGGADSGWGEARGTPLKPVSSNLTRSGTNWFL